MMPTIVFLVLAMLPVTCLMETTNVPHGCIKVNFPSFVNTGTATLGKTLGFYCKLFYSKMHLSGTWIGINGQDKICTVCCIRQDTEGNLHYNLTVAPRTYPCLNGKCNSKGKCIKKKRT
uniref:Putative ixostatin n=1 Tax=Ixodes ricinus TaxID=34613 RepID=A0A0K8RDJ2_IXORI